MNPMNSSLSYQFRGHSPKGGPVNFEVQIDKKLVKQANKPTSILSSEDQVAEEHSSKELVETYSPNDILISRVLAEVCQEQSKLNSTDGPIRVNIENIESVQDEQKPHINYKVTYTIESEAGNPVHELPIRLFDAKKHQELLNAAQGNKTLLKGIKKSEKESRKDTKKVHDAVLKYSISPAGPALANAQIQQTLERFCSIADLPTSFSKRLASIVARVFEAILSNFRFLDRLWAAIGGESIDSRAAKRFKWDLQLLTDICGAPPTEQMNMKQALEYMSQMHQRDRSRTASNELSDRIGQAAGLAHRIESLRKNYKKSEYNKLLDQVDQSLVNLQEGKKLLLPLGYYEGEKLIEVLLEVTKDSQGRCKIALCSAGEPELFNLFDREFISPHSGENTVGYALRREIIGVDFQELRSRLTSWIELQASPRCTASNQRKSYRDSFVQTLKFHHSSVNAIKPVKRRLEAQHPGKLSELISYSSSQLANAQEASHFEIAFRLRTFLDLCHSDSKSLQNISFWKIARSSAYMLLETIEANKEIFGESAHAQSAEIGGLYIRLRQTLEHIESICPDTAKLDKQHLPTIKGPIIAQTEPSVPPLIPLTQESAQGFQIRPDFNRLDLNDPIESIQSWSARLRQLIDRGEISQAGREARACVAMLQLLPVDYWKRKSEGEAKQLLAGLNTLAEAIGRESSFHPQSNVDKIASLVALNFYAYELSGALRAFNDLGDMKEGFVFGAYIALNEHLRYCPSFDKRFKIDGISYATKDLNCFNDGKLKKRIKNSLQDDLLDSSTQERKYQLKEVKELALSQAQGLAKAHQNDLQPLLNISQFLAMSVCGKKADQLSLAPIDFAFTPNGLVKGPEDKISQFIQEPDKPLFLQPPAYASDLSTDIINRYVSEKCCLGCMRDNCPNYAQVPLGEHRFHPLFMLHNFVDTFCHNLCESGSLDRDEAVAIMSTQQTNRDANLVWSQEHDQSHGFNVANGFSDDDRAIQLINTLKVFFDRPHFFERPDLRWLFELKVFGNRGLECLLKTSESGKDYKPLLIAAIEVINRQVRASAADDNVKQAVYLLSVANKLKEYLGPVGLEIEVPPLSDYLVNKTRELIGRNPEMEKTQLMLFSLSLENYHAKFFQNAADPIFSSDEHLEMILACSIRLEELVISGATVDPSLLERARTLVCALRPTFAARANSQGVNFVNNICAQINPLLARMGLKWVEKGFPVFQAKTDTGSTYYFDLLSGRLSEGETLLAELGEHIKQNEGVGRLFSKALRDNWQMIGLQYPQDETDVVGYTHKDYPNLRILNKIQKPSVSSPNLTQKVVIERSFVDKEGVDRWLTYVSFNEQKRLLAGLGEPALGDMPTAMAVSIGARSCWIDRRGQHLYVFEDDGKLFATIHLEKQADQDNFQATRLCLEEKGTDLLKPEKDVMGRFSSIEDPNFIQVWGKRGAPDSIQYTRYELSSSNMPLSYTISSKGVASTNYPGYTLAPFGSRAGKSSLAMGEAPLPPTFDHFQLLTHGAKQKVLIPMCQLQLELAVDGSKLQQSKPLFSSEFKENILFEFQLNSETNRLETQDSSGYVYLAYICFVHHDIASACYYLDKARTSSGYTPVYDIVHAWVRQLDTPTLPSAAMQLRFELQAEKVYQDRYLFLIQSGGLQAAQQLEVDHGPRLVRIAQLYERYRLLEAKASAFDLASAVSYKLSDSEHSIIQSFITKLLQERGNDTIPQDEQHLLPAQRIPLSDYVRQPERHAGLDLSSSAIAIWAFKGLCTSTDTEAFRSPIWILQSFESVFNELLTQKVDSARFKQLEHQVQMLTQANGDGLTKVEADCIKLAQVYLLKLIHLRYDNPGAATEIFEEDLEGGRLAVFQGQDTPEQRNEDLHALKEVMDELPYDCFNDLDKLRGQLQKLKNKYYPSALPGMPGNDWHDKRQQQRERLKYNKAVASGYEAFTNLPADTRRSLKIFMAAEEGLDSLQRTRLKDGQSINRSPEEILKLAQIELKEKLLTPLLGAQNAAQVLKFNSLIKKLDRLQMVEPKQVHQLTPALAPPTAMTYAQRYRVLLTDHMNSESQLEQIHSLELTLQNQSSSPASADTQNYVLSAGSPVLSSDLGKLQRCFGRRRNAMASPSESVFDNLLNSSEPAFKRLAQEHRDDMRAYASSQGKGASQAREMCAKEATLNLAMAKELHKATTSLVNNLHTEHDRAKADLLQIVDRFEAPSGLLAIRRQLGLSAKPTLEWLIAAWRRGEFEDQGLPWENHPFAKLGIKRISGHELKRIDKMIMSYLELSTKLQHAKRVHETAASCLESFSKDGKGDEQLVEALYEVVTTKRYYELNAAANPDYRDLLFLEYTQQMILRDTQVETLKEMRSNPNTVQQLRMGGGKSKVLLPMLAKRKAHGGNLVMLMLPEELYETNCKDLDATNRQLFGQEMMRFEFNRRTEQGLKSLQTIYHKLLTTAQEKGFIMTTKRSMLSFKNAYLALLYTYQSHDPTQVGNTHPDLIERIQMMSRILKLFQDRADVIADEVDACLDVRKEVNFSIGSSIKVNPRKASMAFDLMHVLFTSTNPLLSKLATEIQRNTQAALAGSEREQMLQELVSSYFDRHLEDSGFKKLELIPYIFNKDPAAHKETEARVFALANRNFELFQQIATLKSFIERGLGPALGKVGNVNFGRDPVSDIWTIPYKASNTPQIGSEFDDDIEQLTFTLLDYVQNDVRLKQVYQLIASFRHVAVAELSDLRSKDPLMTIDQTQSAAQFEQFMQKIDPNRSLPQNLKLSGMKKRENIEALLSAINSSVLGKLYYCLPQVLSQISLFPDQIHSVSADLPDMVNNFSGFTGTPWNRLTYHDKISAKKGLGVDGSTWSILLAQNVPVISFDFDAEQPIDSLLNQLDVVGNYQAVIDTGAYLRGANNSEFAQKSLAAAKARGVALAGAIFFDESGRIVMQRQKEQTVIPIEGAPTGELMDNITLYDQAHTVGADIKQGRKARAIVTIGENTFIRDLFQAVWRLRQLSQEQRVVFAISDKLKERILGGQQRDLSVNDILEFCLANEARREAEDNFRAESEKIRGATKREVLRLIVNTVIAGAKPEQIHQLAHTLTTTVPQVVIKRKDQEEAYKQYAMLKVDEDPEKLLLAAREQAANLSVQAAKCFQDISNPSQQALEALAGQIRGRASKDPAWFPKQVQSASSGAEVEQEAQQEISQEIALELVAEKIQETSVVKEKEVVIPIANAGSAGSGNVDALSIAAINSMYLAPTTTSSSSFSFNTNPINNASSDLPRKLSNTIEFFDETIYCSATFERNLFENKPKATPPPQAAFYTNRKVADYVLITKQQGRWRMLIPTLHEAHGACTDYVRRQANSDPNQTQSHLISVGPNCSLPVLSSHNLSEQDKKAFYRLYIQAKLFRGDIEFAKEAEAEALKAWLIEKDAASFKQYFETVILPPMPNRVKKAYATSSLFAIFEELTSKNVKV